LQSAGNPYPKTPLAPPGGWCVPTWLRAVFVVLALAATGVGATACGPATPERAPDAAFERIVSLMPAVTETLIALGAGDRLVGIGRFDPPVPGRPDLPRLGDAFDVSLESVTGLEPDLVLLNSRRTAAALAPLAKVARVETVPTDRLADVLESIGRIGVLLGVEDRATALREGLEADLAAARARAAARIEAPAPTVLVVLQHRPFYVAGGGSYVHELLTVIGARNVTGDLVDAWPTLSAEALVARAPEVVLDASQGVEPEADAAVIRERWERFETLPAVRSGRVHAVVGDALFRPGPRIPEALEQLEELVYGEHR